MTVALVIFFVRKKSTLCAAKNRNTRIELLMKELEKEIAEMKELKNKITIEIRDIAKSKNENLGKMTN